jgi:hypothetical protein
MPGPCALPSRENEEEAPDEIEVDKADLGEAILDTQRDLALARKLSDRSPEDYDSAQIEWLRNGLAEVKEEEARLQEQDSAARIWRIVYMHHPLYTSTPSHGERGDSVGVRHNLQEILRDADVVIAGHSHGFEWLHSKAAPNQCFLVTGAGGQSRLQGSVFSPQLAERYQPIIESITEAGLDSLVWASGTPTSIGATVEDKIFSYLRIRVRLDELQIEPVGVRQHAEEDNAPHDDGAGWERIHPMPVQDVPDAQSWRSGGSKSTRSRHLHHISIRRDEPPTATWHE